jgi:hypothetical protein
MFLDMGKNSQYVAKEKLCSMIPFLQEKYIYIGKQPGARQMSLLPLLIAI